MLRVAILATATIAAARGRALRAREAALEPQKSFAEQNAITATSYPNAALEPPAALRTQSTLNNASLPAPDAATPWSAELVGTLAFGDAEGDSFVISCDLGTSKAVLVWIDDHLVCQKGLYDIQPEDAGRVDGSEFNPLIKLRRRAVVVRARFWLDAGADLAGVTVAWAADGGAARPIDAALLSPEISADEARREALQRGLARGKQLRGRLPRRASRSRIK